MGVEAQDLVGWLLTISIAVIGWLIYRLTAAIKTNNDLLKAEIKTVKEDAESDLDKAKTSYKNMGSRLDGEIKSLRNTVVFTDVFAQHEKLENLRYTNIKQMYDGLSDQLGNINKKIDTLIEAALKRANGG